MVRQGGALAGMVLEKELRVLHLDLQAAGERLCTGCSLSTCETLKSAPTVTHFLYQGHIYSNKATPPKSATSYGLSIQTLDSMGDIPIQTTTRAFPSQDPVCPHFLPCPVASPP